MNIPEVITLLEKASGPDRWLDAKIDAVIRVGTIKMNKGGYEWAWDNFPRWAHHSQARGMCGAVAFDNGDLGMVWDSLPFTESVDAALAVLDRALPGWFWRCGATTLFPNGWAHVSRYDGSNCNFRDEAACADGKASTPAIALCIAVLKAKLMQEVNL